MIKTAKSKRQVLGDPLLWVILATIFSELVLGLMFSLALRETLTLCFVLASLAILVSLLMKRPEYYLTILVLYVIALPRTVILDLRLHVGAFVFGILDLLIILLIMGAFLRVAVKRSVFNPASLTFPVLAFLAMSVLSALLGLWGRNSSYAIIQDLRIPFFMGATYFCTLTLLKEDCQAKSVIKAVVVGFAVASVLQISTLLTSPIHYSSLAPTDPIRSLDLFSVQFGVAIAILVSALLCAPALLGKRMTYLLLVLNLLGFLASLTRGMWVATSVSLLFIFALASAREKNLVVRQAILALIIIIIGILGFDFLVPREPSVRTVVEQKLNSFGSLSTVGSLNNRLSETLTAVGKLHGLDFLWGKGLGFRFIYYKPLYRVDYEGTYMHNSYAHYFVKSGLLGLSVLLALCFLFIRRGIRIYRSNVSPFSNLVSLGLTSGLCGFFVSALVGGDLSDPFQAPLWGIAFGLLDVIAQEPKTLKGGTAIQIKDRGQSPKARTLGNTSQDTCLSQPRNV